NVCVGLVVFDSSHLVKFPLAVGCEFFVARTLTGLVGLSVLKNVGRRERPLLSFSKSFTVVLSMCSNVAQIQVGEETVRAAMCMPTRAKSAVNSMPSLAANIILFLAVNSASPSRLYSFFSTR